MVMLVMSLKQRKRNFNQGWIHLQLRPVSTVVLLPRRTQKFDSRTVVARRLKPSRATAVYYAAVAHWNFLLFLGQKTLKKIMRQLYVYVANESTLPRIKLNHNIHIPSDIHTLY